MTTENARAVNVGQAATAEMSRKPHLTTYLYAPLLDLLEADQLCLEALEDVVNKAQENVQSIDHELTLFEMAVKFKKYLWILMVATRIVEQRVSHAISNH